MSSKASFLLGFASGVLVSVIGAVAFCLNSAGPERYELSNVVDIGAACYDSEPPLSGQIAEGSIFQIDAVKGPVWYISFQTRVPRSFVDSHAKLED